ncbi:slr1658 superfamily regulator [Rhizobium bangladeshense]|uniref:slr1658 superfamily regulator n=1 Tax=Rhizobium bangladeshense TaxID=1138189 RepID=UPI001C83DC65|nr:hypothetical protein [Rhizobium bangladeshense]MBX4888789.1 hypothetical protein [Rhizobium bangladeshense]MBX4897353.1 hypothetical protein [Rhizobium bangladeshense]MBX4900656.1 hypothetical protein [Rhizobium bangladeshense]MBX4912863.1 hypothetical protein [Rhizobium bangladeshense]MBX4919418.1 hypothetical protein [Rhizobium bangladeshense]
MAPRIYGIESLVDISLDSGARLKLSDGPLQLGWKHSGMTSDFIAEIMALPYARSRKDYLQAHHDIGYLSNELIENAVKFRQPGEILIEAGMVEGSFLIRVKNAIDSETSSRFQQLLHRLQLKDPGVLLLEQIETNAISPESGSGLGLLTLLSDYDARMAWTFEENKDEHIILTTTAAVAMPPSSNL